MIRARAALGFSLLVVTLVAGSAAAQSAAQSRPGIAVFPLEFGGTLGNRVEGFDRLSIGLQQMLLNHFAQNPGVRIVERSHLNRIMDEQKLARDSMVDTNTAARLGKLVGARYMVMGGYAELPDLELSARIVDTETSEVIYSRRVSGKRDKVMNMLTDLGNQLEQGFRGLPALPAGVREARQQVGELPADVAITYSLAMTAAERGQKDRAISLYQQIARRFPNYSPVQEALKQLSTSS